MRHHLVCRPVQRFLETIDILKMDNVANRRHTHALFKILDKVHFMETLFKRIPATQLPVLYFKDVQPLILTRAQGKLDIALIAQHKLSLELLRFNHLPLTVILGLGFERHQVELSQLRRGL